MPNTMNIPTEGDEAQAIVDAWLSEQGIAGEPRKAVVSVIVQTAVNFDAPVALPQLNIDQVKELTDHMSRELPMESFVQDPDRWETGASYVDWDV